MKKLLTAFALAAVLGACGGAGAGGAAPTGTKTGATTVPIVAGTEAPKEYKTPAPSGSPDDYYGY